MKLNKKQKRTATIASMAALLAVVLGMGGQTFAKYVETHDAKTAQATVAKFGFVVTTNVDNLFGTQYGRANADDAYATIANKGGKISVSGADKRVAPGTEGFMTILVEGISEVTAALSISVDSVSDVYVKQGASEVYNPVKWTLTEGSNTIFEDTKTAEMQTALSSYVLDIAPAQEISMTFTLSWKWDFETVTTDEITPEAIAANKAQNNTYDTMLAHAAVDSTDVPSGYECGTTLAADFTISVEQTKI